MKVVKLEQGTPEWLDLRRTKRCASETPIVMGVSPWGNWRTLRDTKNGNGTFKGNAATRHGHALEPEARQAFRLEHGIVCEPLIVVDGDYLASLDGYGEGVPVEIKCPYSGRNSSTWQAIEREEIEPHYHWQVQHQLMVTGADFAYFAVYVEGELRVLKIEPNPDMWADICMSWDEFDEWRNQQDAAPPAGDDFRMAAALYRSLKTEADAIAGKLEEARQALIAGMTSEDVTEFNGVTVTKVVSKGGVDYKKVPELQGVNLDKYRKPDTTSYRVTVK